MSVVVTDDQAMVETMKGMTAHLGITLKVETLPNGPFRLTMSDEDAAKLRQLTGED